MENLELNKETTDLINNGIKDIPYKCVFIKDILGTKVLFIILSFEEKKHWHYNILENSIHANFNMYEQKGLLKLQLLTKDYQIKIKFRKTIIKDVNDIINKINNYIDSVNLSIDKLKTIC